MNLSIVDKNNIENETALLENANISKAIMAYPKCVLFEDGYIILDFHQEIYGRAHIVFGGNHNESYVRVRLGESVYETCADVGEKNAGNDHSLRDNEYRAISNGDVSVSESGFRFLRIDNVSGKKLVQIARIYVEPIENGFKEKGYFICNDQRVNDIYETAKRTISLCVRKDNVWDGIKRDRMFWIGDFYPELTSMFYTYGPVPEIEKLIRESIFSFDTWVNCIPSYSAWWIICLAKYYEMSGRKQFVKEMIPNLDFIVDSFYQVITEDGDIDYSRSKLTYFEGNEFFIDWPTNFTNDAKTGWKYIVSLAMEKASLLYSISNRDSSKAEACKERLKKSDFEDSSFKQVTALGMLANMIDYEKGRELIEKNTIDGMTCFMSFAIIEAMEKISDGNAILKIIKDYYGAMIDLGATTFWEDFDMAWLRENPDPITALPSDKTKNIHADFGKFCYKNLRMSLCHGWSTGFMEFFFEYVLGVTPLKEGYSVVKVEPHLCGLTKVEGAIPTKYGIIHVRHELVDGKIETKLELPKKIVLSSC